MISPWTRCARCLESRRMTVTLPAATLSSRHRFSYDCCMPLVRPAAPAWLRYPYRILLVRFPQEFCLAWTANDSIHGCGPERQTQGLHAVLAKIPQPLAVESVGLRHHVFR